VDFGCGDWQFSHLIDWRGIDYVGIDTVAAVIERNKSMYGHSGVNFMVGASLAIDAPAADLLVIKDVFQHWRNRDICEAFASMSKFVFVLITNTRYVKCEEIDNNLVCDAKVNQDIPLGCMRPLDLRLAPFAWPLKDVFEYSTRRIRVKALDVKVVSLLAPERSAV
jgi:hypothetical protein